MSPKTLLVAGLFHELYAEVAGALVDEQERAAGARRLAVARRLHAHVADPGRRAPVDQPAAADLDLVVERPSRRAAGAGPPGRVRVERAALDPPEGGPADLPGERAAPAVLGVVGRDAERQPVARRGGDDELRLDRRLGRVRLGLAPGVVDRLAD